MERNRDIDFVKGIMITLMVLFHLVYFASYYHTLDHLVYSFHMPVFMLISGYLFSFEKDSSYFLKYLRSLAVPYIAFTSIYYLAFSLLGKYLVTEGSLNDFSVLNYLNTLFLHPTATYWFIHTIIIASGVVYLTNKIKISIISRLFIIGLCFWCLSYIAKWQNINMLAMYLLGHMFRTYKGNMMMVLSPSPLAIIPLVLTYFFADLYYCGIIIVAINTISAISLCTWISSHINAKVSGLIEWIGKNTLQILLLSPFLAVLTKLYIPLFSFDSTRILWAIVSTVLVFAGCLGLSWISDKAGVSRLLMGRNFIRQ